MYKKETLIQIKHSCGNYLRNKIHEFSYMVFSLPQKKTDSHARTEFRSIVERITTTTTKMVVPSQILNETENWNICVSVDS